MMTSLPPVRFSGRRTTALAEERLLSGNETRRALQQDDDPYLGEAPAIPGLPVHAGQLLAQFDRLAARLNREKRPANFKYENEGVQMSGESLGRGAYGTCYHIRINGESFVFKVFHKPPPPATRLLIAVDRLLRGGHHGPYAESATGLFANRQGVSDVIRFYCGNPQAGWYLAEFIDKRGAAPKPGDKPRGNKTMEEAGYIFEDDVPYNRINGIRVDLGGLLSDTRLHRLMVRGGKLLEPFLARSPEQA